MLTVGRVTVFHGLEIVGGLPGEGVETVIPAGTVDEAGKTDAEMTDSADDRHMADDDGETQIITRHRRGSKTHSRSRCSQSIDGGRSSTPVT